MDKLTNIVKQFTGSDTSAQIQPYGSGRINQTFLITVKNAPLQFILQQINQTVFSQPAWIVQNIKTVTDHVHHQLKKENPETGKRWEIPCIIPTIDGNDYFIDPQNRFWRALSFIENTRSFDAIVDFKYAEEVGYVLGKFQYLIAELPANLLHNTLDGFHITPRYLYEYDAVCAKHQGDHVSQMARFCHNFIQERRQWAGVLEQAKMKGELKVRPIHGDPKKDNILVDCSTGVPISLIDLDTVQPGLIQYDLGDCLRSCCNIAGEDPQSADQVRFDTDMCQRILKGYFEETSIFFSQMDYFYLYDAICLLPFELGLRFFTDYLDGNTYFKVSDQEQNLYRALVQFKLTESIESQKTAINRMIDDHA